MKEKRGKSRTGREVGGEKRRKNKEQRQVRKGEKRGKGNTITTQYNNIIPEQDLPRVPLYLTASTRTPILTESRANGVFILRSFACSLDICALVCKLANVGKADLITGMSSWIAVTSSSTSVLGNVDLEVGLQSLVIF